jgi:hypothetical protein
MQEVLRTQVDPVQSFAANDTSPVRAKSAIH